LAALAAGMWPKAVGRRAGRFLQGLGGRRMVAMGMGDQDMGDLLVGEARQQCRDVLRELGAGVDDRHLTFADDIGAGALERERPGVARDDTADPRRDGFEPAVFEDNLAAKGNVDSHGRFASGWVAPSLPFPAGLVEPASCATMPPKGAAA